MAEESIKSKRKINTLYVFYKDNQVYKRNKQKEWLPISFKWEAVINY
jgi:hypothetical protein